MPGVTVSTAKGQIASNNPGCQDSEASYDSFQVTMEYVRKVKHHSSYCRRSIATQGYVKRDFTPEIFYVLLWSTYFMDKK